MKIQYKGLIREKMMKTPVTIQSDASFFEARHLMREKGVNHLPVMDKKDRLIGIVTDRDIREAAPSDATTLSVHEINYLLEKLKVSDFMTKKEKLVTLHPDTLVEEAALLMQEKKIGSLPLVEGEKLVGVVTKTDLLDLLIDLFGLKTKGTRLTIALKDEPGKMVGVLETMKNHGVNVISIASPTFSVEGKRVAAIRVQTEDYKPVVKELEEKGYDVLSVDRWGTN